MKWNDTEVFYENCNEIDDVISGNFNEKFCKILEFKFNIPIFALRVLNRGKVNIILFWKYQYVHILTERKMRSRVIPFFQSYNMSV